MTNIFLIQAKDLSNEDLHSAFSALNGKLNSKEDSACVLRMANRIFARKNLEIKDSFTTCELSASFPWYLTFRLALNFDLL